MCWRVSLYKGIPGVHAVYGVCMYYTQLVQVEKIMIVKKVPEKEFNPLPSRPLFQNLRPTLCLPQSQIPWTTLNRDVSGSPVVV